MTFITAIQLNDSIIVTADNKEVILKETNEVPLSQKQCQKIHPWDKGIITGTGESCVIGRAITLFQEISQSELVLLPHCLDLSRQIREYEIGTGYFQVENTKNWLQDRRTRRVKQGKVSVRNAHWRLEVAP